MKPIQLPLRPNLKAGFYHHLSGSCVSVGTTQCVLCGKTIKVVSCIVGPVNNVHIPYHKHQGEMCRQSGLQFPGQVLAASDGLGSFWGLRLCETRGPEVWT